MDKERIERINQLARTAKHRPLSKEELDERVALREEYLAAFRESTRQQLDAITILHPDGTKEKMRDRRPD